MRQNEKREQVERGDVLFDSLTQNDNSRESDSGEGSHNHECHVLSPRLSLSRRVRLGTENTPLSPSLCLFLFYSVSAGMESQYEQR